MISGEWVQIKSFLLVFILWKKDSIKTEWYKKIMSYPLDGCVPGCREVEDKGRRLDWRIWAHDLCTARRGEVIRVSMRRDMAKKSLITEGVSRPPNSTNRTEKTIWVLQNYSPLETVLNTTRKDTERQQDIKSSRFIFIFFCWTWHFGANQ